MTMKNLDGVQGTSFCRVTDSIMELTDVRPDKRNIHHMEAERIFKEARFSKDELQKLLSEDVENNPAVYNIHTLEDWRNVYVLGWEKGTQRLDAARAVLHPGKADTLRRRPIKGPFGDEIDIHRVYRGQLETAWTARKPKFVPGAHQLTLWLDVNAWGTTSGDGLFWRGAAALAVAQALEEAGYQIEIQLMERIGHLYAGHRDTMVTVLIKTHGERINPAKCAVLMCHPCTLRTAFFAWELSMKASANSGMGICVKCRPPGWREEDIVCPAITSEDGARRWMERTMAEYISS